MLRDNYVFVLVDRACGQAAVVDPAVAEPVMGLQHHSELQLLGLQGRHHRFSHRWIDNGRLAASAIHQHKNIVIPQHGQPLDLHADKASDTSVEAAR